MFYLTTQSTHFIYDYMASDSKRRNLLQPHGLLFHISNMGSFICSHEALAGMRNSSVGEIGLV